MFLDVIKAMFPGALDCAMRDREGFCASARKKTSSRLQRPELRHEDVTAASPYEEIQTLDRLPSPGLSSYDLARASLGATSMHELNASRSFFVQPGYFLEEFPRELPHDFYSKLASCLCTDHEIQNRFGSARFCTGDSACARFLQECVGGNEQGASQLWRSLSVCEKQELRMTYACGPSSPDYLVNIMVGQHSSRSSECGSSSARSDYTS